MDRASTFETQIPTMDLREADSRGFNPPVLDAPFDFPQTNQDHFRGRRLVAGATAVLAVAAIAVPTAVSGRANVANAQIPVDETDGTSTNQPSTAPTTETTPTTQSSAPDWIGGADYPKLYRGKRAKYAFSIAGEHVDDFTATLDKKSTTLKLLMGTAHPAAHKEDGKPTWHLGQLNDFSRYKHFSFQMRVSKHAKIGQKACVWLHFDPAKATSDPHGRRFGKICSKVQRQR